MGLKHGNGELPGLTLTSSLQAQTTCSPSLVILAAPPVKNASIFCCVRYVSLDCTPSAGGILSVVSSNEIKLEVNAQPLQKRDCGVVSRVIRACFSPSLRHRSAGELLFALAAGTDRSHVRSIEVLGKLHGLEITIKVPLSWDRMQTRSRNPLSFSLQHL